jgi:Domain of unknown function (DUF4190)
MENQHAPQTPPTASSGLAIVSLICGIGSVIFGPLTGIPAIITGHIALGKIKKSGGVLQGRGLAITGLILGYVLTVLTVIVIALAYSGIRSAVNKAHNVQTRHAATEIDVAIKNFFDEYGALPSNATSDATFCSNKDIAMFAALLGDDTTLNPKSIQFLSMRVGKDMKNGIIYDASGTSIIGIFDPWGGAYNVRLDLDYDDQIEVNGETIKGLRAAVWSNGPDMKDGTSDDIKSW